MADKRILTDRVWNVEGSWYAPKQFIKENFRSVVFCDYISTSSSAGDWNGLIVQRFGNKLSTVIFSQENNHPNSGFTVTTDSKVYETTVSKDFREYQTIFEEFINNMYE